MKERNKRLNDYLLSLTDERAGQMIKNWIAYQRTGEGLFVELQHFAEVSRVRAELARGRRQERALNQVINN